MHTSDAAQRVPVDVRALEVDGRPLCTVQEGGVLALRTPLAGLPTGTWEVGYG